MILSLTIIRIKGEYFPFLLFCFCYYRVKGGHYVATNGRDTPDPPYVHANRGYWTDGEESHRAPSERTMSEYTVNVHSLIHSFTRFSLIETFHFFFFLKITNERTSPPHPPARKSKVDRSENGGPRSLVMSPSNGPPNRIPPRAPSALSYDHGGDTGSDIYVTSAAYKAPSEIRQVAIVIGYHNITPSFLWVLLLLNFNEFVEKTKNRLINLINLCLGLFSMR